MDGVIKSPKNVKVFLSEDELKARVREQYEINLERLFNFHRLAADSQPAMISDNRSSSGLTR